MSLVGRMRPLRCELNFLDKADGSCSYSQGKTVVWASCSGPGDVHVTRRENEKMHLDVSFRQLTGDCQHHPLNRVLEATLENTVNTHLFPRTSLVVTVHCLQTDGSIGAAALTAAGLSLLDNGIPCRAPFCGVQVVRIGEQFVIDPDQKTEDKADANFLFAFQMSSEGGASLIVSDSNGPFTLSHFSSALSLASEGAKQIFSFYKETLQRKLSVDAFGTKV